MQSNQECAHRRKWTRSFNKPHFLRHFETISSVFVLKFNLLFNIIPKCLCCITLFIKVLSILYFCLYREVHCSIQTLFKRSERPQILMKLLFALTLVQICVVEVQSAKKERTNQLNSKFDKTYKHFFKVLSQFDIQRK